MAIAMTSMAVSAQNQPGIKPENMDKTVKPQDDFYMYATGGWQKRNPLPAAYSRFGSFDQLQEDNNKRINSILDELQKKKFAEGTTERKLSDFYKLAMDAERRNKEGIAPVKPLLDEMEEADTKDDLFKIQKKYAVFGYGVPFGSGFSADAKNVTMNIFHVSQGGLTLGQKDYYLNNDEATVKIREAYKKHIVKMFKLFGFDEDDAIEKRDAIFRYETALALISKSRTELRDPQSNYNKMTLKEFQTNYPNIPLEVLANAEGVKSEYIQEMIVGQPKFMEGLDKLSAALNADDLKAYMQWDVITSSASLLSDEIREANFEFFGKTMSGRKEDYPLWKRATNSVQSVMGEALGKMYCDRYFPASSKILILTVDPGMAYFAILPRRLSRTLQSISPSALTGSALAASISVVRPFSWKRSSNSPTAICTIACRSRVVMCSSTFPELIRLTSMRSVIRLLSRFDFRSSISMYPFALSFPISSRFRRST